MYVYVHINVYIYICIIWVILVLGCIYACTYKYVCAFDQTYVNVYV